MNTNTFYRIKVSNDDNIPSPRDFHVSALIGNELYIIGVSFFINDLVYRDLIK
jgi:hypothetical protein